MVFWLPEDCAMKLFLLSPYQGMMSCRCREGGVASTIPPKNSKMTASNTTTAAHADIISPPLPRMRLLRELVRATLTKILHNTNTADSKEGLDGQNLHKLSRS